MLSAPACHASVDTEAISAHLAEVSATVASDAHAVLILDGTGWHSGGNLIVPANLTLLYLPPNSPELDLAENIWAYLRQNWLANSVFDSYEAPSRRAAWPGTASSTVPIVRSVTSRAWMTINA